MAPRTVTPAPVPSPGPGTDRRTMDALVAVGRAMVATTDHERMLADVIETACRAVDAGTGAFMLYDPAREELVLQKPAFGVYADEQVAAYRVPISGGSNAARVFLSREPYLANDAQRNPRLVQRFVRMFDTHNTVTVPLLLGERSVGVFHAINKRAGPFTGDDLAVLGAVAPLLAASLQSARMFRAVEEERRKLERTMLVHDELTRIVVAAEGIAPLCDTLHRLVGRPVMILDLMRHPLATAGWPDLVPAQLAAIRAQLGGGPGLQRARLGPGRRAEAWFVAVPIVLGGHAGGYLVIGEDGRPLDPIDTKAVEQAATVFALELLQERTAFESERRVTGALLGTLFREDADDADAHDVLRRLGYVGDGPWRVVRLEPSAPTRATAPLDLAQLGVQLRRALADALAALGIGTPLAPWHNGFVTLITPAQARALRDRRLVQRFAIATGQGTRRADGIALHVGVGRAETEPRHLRLSLRSAEQALAAAQRLPAAGKPVFFEELGVYRLLLGGNRIEDHAEFIAQVLGKVSAADAADRRRSLMSTLEALAAEGFRVRETAARLGIHPNTMKYRLRQLTGILGAEPGRGELRLEIELALKLAGLQRAGAPHRRAPR